MTDIHEDPVVRHRRVPRTRSAVWDWACGEAISPMELVAVPEGGESTQGGGMFVRSVASSSRTSWPWSGLIVIVAFVLFCFVGPLLYHTNQTNQQAVLGTVENGAARQRVTRWGPTARGFDILGRLMYGGQTSLIVGFASAFVATRGRRPVRRDRRLLRWLGRRRHDAVRRHAPLHPHPVPADRHGRPSSAPAKCSSSSSSPSSVGSFPARLIRGETLTLRVREYVQAVRVMGGAREPHRRSAHHPQLGRHHRGVRHLPGRRLDPPAGRPGLPRASGSRRRDRLGQHALRRSRTRPATATGGRSTRPGSPSSWWWWPSISWATPCGTRSRSDCSGAEVDRGVSSAVAGGSRRPVRQRHRRLQREVAGREVATRRTGCREARPRRRALRPWGTECGNDTPRGGPRPRAARPAPLSSPPCGP